MLCSFAGGHSEDDSKQAAEAMVQLSGVGFYSQQGQFQVQTKKKIKSQAISNWKLYYLFSSP